MKIFLRSIVVFVIVAGIAFYAISKNASRKSAAPGLVFVENSWPEALKQASVKHKYIFVDAYATWCGPCKMMRSTTFKDKRVIEFFNKNFVNAALDMEKGQGPQLAQAWQLQAYPTLYVFDEQGKPVLYAVGYIDANELLKFGQAALKKKN